MGKETKSGFVAVLRKEGKLMPLIAAALIGILLLALAGIWENGGNKEKAQDSVQVPSSTDASLTTGNFLQNYEQQLEEKIRLICSDVGGVGEVRVCVYIDEAFDYIGTGTADSPYVSLVAPAIKGIGVVCDGGNSPDIKKELTMLISTAFSIGSNKIYITGT